MQYSFTVEAETKTKKENKTLEITNEKQSNVNETVVHIQNTTEAFVFHDIDEYKR